MTQVITVTAARADLAARVAALDADARIVAVAGGSARVVDHEGLDALFDDLAERVIVDASASRAWIGRAGAVAAVLSGQSAIVDSEREVVACLDGTDTDVIVLGRWVVAASPRSEPLVVVGEDAALAHVDRLLVESAGADLARVIGYREAVADGPLVDLGHDLLAVPFWTPAMCRAVIVAAEAADAWGSDDTDPVPGEEVSLATISPVLFGSVESHMQELVLPLARVHWPLLADAGMHDAFVIKYGASGAVRELRLHHDVAQISGSIRLNEGYEGGVLEFPQQGYANGDVAVGTMLLWPSLVTHPHRSTPVLRGVKYGLTVWMRLPAG